MSRLPSASRLQLASICAGSSALPTVATAWESGSRGTALHEYASARLTGTTQEAALTALPDELLDATDALEVGIELFQSMTSEAAYAWDYVSGVGRHLGNNLGRKYNSTETEFAGAADALGVDQDDVVVVDLKTGRGSVAAPDRNMQLRFLALAACRAHGFERARVGLWLAPAGSEPRWQWAHLDAFELAVVETELRDIARRVLAAREAVAKGETPRLTIGEHCSRMYCPSAVYCPARSGLAHRLGNNLAEWRAELVALFEPSTAGQVYQRVKAARAVLNEVETALYGFARENPVDLGNGKWLREHETRREVLDGDVVYKAVAALHGPEVALAAVELKATKAGLERALKSLPGPVAPRARAVLEAVRLAGGAEVKVSTSVGEVDAP